MPSRFTLQVRNMQVSCRNHWYAYHDDTDAEIKSLKTEILAVADITKIDPRFILATIMQVSKTLTRFSNRTYPLSPGILWLRPRHYHIRIPPQPRSHAVARRNRHLQQKLQGATAQWYRHNKQHHVSLPSKRNQTDDPRRNQWDFLWRWLSPD